VAFHELGHVDLNQGVFRTKHLPCEGFGQFGLAHAGRTKEHEGPDRAEFAFQPRPRPADRLGDSLNGFFLPDDRLAKGLFKVQELGGLFGGDLRQGDAGPHRDDLGNVFLAHDGRVRAVPSGL